MRVAKIIAPVVVVAMLLGALGLFVGCGGGQKHSQQLVKGSITIGSGEYYHVQFSVDSGMSDVTVSGSFKASGGSDNDIEVLILDDRTYRNWRGGDYYEAAALYSSGRVTKATFNRRITDSGIYHLIYSNAFAWIETKTVTTSVKLKWSE